MRKACLDMVYELAKTDERIMFIGSDLAAETLKEFRREMPERFFMEGIYESNLIGVAAGLALEGMIPYVNTIATFLTRRCFEQIVLDLCLHQANVRLIGNGGGMVYGPLGPTHLAIEDIAILRAIPNMTILAPADANEMRRLMPLTVNHKGPIYIRLGKGGDPIVTHQHTPLQIGKAVLAREGTDALIVTTGITLAIGLDAAEILKIKGINVTVLHLHTLKPIDQEELLKQIAVVPVVVTLEEHTLNGGLGSIVAELMAEANFSSPKYLKRIGIPDVFPEGYTSQAELMERYSISSENIVATVVRSSDYVKRASERR